MVGQSFVIPCVEDALLFAYPFLDTGVICGKVLSSATLHTRVSLGTLCRADELLPGAWVTGAPFSVRPDLLPQDMNIIERYGLVLTERIFPSVRQYPLCAAESNFRRSPDVTMLV